MTAFLLDPLRTRMPAARFIYRVFHVPRTAVFLDPLPDCRGVGNIPVREDFRHVIRKEMDRG
jgi:hypothetical protein